MRSIDFALSHRCASDVNFAICCRESRLSRWCLTGHETNFDCFQFQVSDWLGKKCYSLIGCSKWNQHLLQISVIRLYKSLFINAIYWLQYIKFKAVSNIVIELLIPSTWLRFSITLSSKYKIRNNDCVTKEKRSPPDRALRTNILPRKIQSIYAWWKRWNNMKVKRNMLRCIFSATLALLLLPPI